MTKKTKNNNNKSNHLLSHQDLEDHWFLRYLSPGKVQLDDAIQGTSLTNERTSLVHRCDFNMGSPFVVISARKLRSAMHAKLGNHLLPFKMNF